jgi:hypothetical protein
MLVETDGEKRWIEREDGQKRIKKVNQKECWIF